MKIDFYTDGASRGNPGKGGWGVYVEIEINGKKEKDFKLSGGSIWTTNNRMEITASLQALRFLDMVLLNKYFVKKENYENGATITIKTDSQYVKNGITLWVENWKKNDWKTANKKPVLNKDLWQELYALKESVNKKLETYNLSNLNFEYVAGHVGIRGNEIADTLATEAADKVIG